jgi:hydroxypyruvate isomerase
MMTFAPNVSWLFPELPFKDRPEAAAKAGFDTIEFGFPSHADLDALQAARNDLDMQIILFNQDVPVWDRQNRGYLVDPKRRDEFRRKLDEALEIARRLEVQKIMLPVGVEVAGMSHQAMRACMVENLHYAGPLATQMEVMLTIEALNPQDNPGYFLTSSRQALEIVKEVNHPNVRFQLDTYHLQMMEGNLVQTLVENQAWIGHIQFADYPGRHEPGTGSIDFMALIQTIEHLGYSGAIGLEYIPLASGVAALEWASLTLSKKLTKLKAGEEKYD